MRYPRSPSAIDLPSDFNDKTGMADHPLSSSGLTLDQVEIDLGTRRLVTLDRRIGPGEVLTVMGDSGSGKSSLLDFIAGFLDPAFRARGRIWLDGTEITSLPPQERKVGLMFQAPLLFPHMSVGENLLFSLDRIKDQGREQRRVLAEELLDRALQDLEGRQRITARREGDEAPGTPVWDSSAFFRGAWSRRGGGVGSSQLARGLLGTPRCKRAGVYGALRPRGGQRLSSEEGAMAAAARRPVCCARQPFSGRSDGVEGRATMLSYAPSHLMVRSLGNKCLLRARAQRPRLNNPTRLLYSNLAAFSCFRGPRTPPPALDDVVPGAILLPSLGLPRGANSR